MVLAFSVFPFFCVDFSLCWSSLFCCCYKMATITLKIMSVFNTGKKEQGRTSHIGLLNQGGPNTNHPPLPRLPHDFLDQSWFTPRTEHILLWLQSGSRWRGKEETGSGEAAGACHAGISLSHCLPPSKAAWTQLTEPKHLPYWRSLQQWASKLEDGFLNYRFVFFFLIHKMPWRDDCP